MANGLVRVGGRRERLALRAARADVHDYLSFRMGGELYAVELGAVQEIVVPPPITPIPRAPAAVRGVCSVRGQLVTVVGLRACLSLPVAPRDRRTRILLGRVDEEELMGLEVDEVCQVVRLAEEEVEATTQSLGGDLSDAVRGIGRPENTELLVLLDLGTLLRRGYA